MKKQKLPVGMTHQTIAEIASLHKNQTEAEAEAEVDAAFADARFSMIQVPVERIDEIRTLLAHPKKVDRVAEPRKRYGK